MTKPCPYCGRMLIVGRGVTYECGKGAATFKWDGKRFRRIRKPRSAA